WALATAGPDAFLAGAPALGRVTAEMHVAMARAFGAQAGDAAAWADAMATQLGRTPGLEHADEAARRYRALAASPAAGVAVRTHGDYHLGQVLRRDDAWYLLDFEGEPARPVAERVAPTSPLKDVAGMLRSFGYAAAVARADAGWEGRARQAFLDAYHATEGISGLLPGDVDLVLGCFELDKAVYEVAYERSHRPSWAQIPLGAVERLLGS
ncbi:MAG: phosphotransferase, partial [Acidimicrobiia bacterium]|nr:phosphotransferase [Acidimicrobiia bacterium]